MKSVKTDGQLIENEKLNSLFVYIPSPKVWMTFYKS